MAVPEFGKRGDVGVETFKHGGQLFVGRYVVLCVRFQQGTAGDQALNKGTLTWVRWPLLSQTRVLPLLALAALFGKAYIKRQWTFP